MEAARTERAAVIDRYRQLMREKRAEQGVRRLARFFHDRGNEWASLAVIG